MGIYHISILLYFRKVACTLFRAIGRLKVRNQKSGRIQKVRKLLIILVIIVIAIIDSYQARQVKPSELWDG